MNISGLFLALIGLYFVFDWGFIVEGHLFVGEGSTDDRIYSLQPAARITPEDRLIETGSKNKPSGTGVLRKIIKPPKTPPISITSLASRILPQIAADARATDVAFYVQQGMQVPIIDKYMLLQEIFKDKEYLINLQIKDELADKLGYSDSTTLKARLEAFTEAYLVLFAKNFARNTTFDYEDQFYLTLLGDPAGSEALKNSAFKFQDFDETYIDPETELPQPIKTEDEFDRMMYDIISCELFTYYPFTAVYPFAPRLDNFAPEFLYPYLKEILLQSHNKRLRRNTIYYLGTIGKYEPLTDLFEILKTTKDNVEKARSLYFLTRHSYPGLAEFLIEEITNETDPVFKMAYINSLGRLRDSKAFPLFVDLLENIKPDYELYYALIRAAMRCIDPNNKKAMDKFGRICNNLYKVKPDAEWIRDPVSEHAVIHKENIILRERGADIKRLTITTEGATGGTRHKILRQLLESTFAAAGNDNPSRELAQKLMSIEEEASKNSSSTELTGEESVLFRLGWNRTVSPTVLEMFPGFTYRGKEIGKEAIEALLVSGADSENTLIKSLDTYYSHFPDEFPGVAEKILANDLPYILKARTIKYLYLSGTADKKTERILEKILKGYRPDMNHKEKHLITLAVFYLGLNGDIKTKLLATIIENELKHLRIDEGVNLGENLRIFDINLVPQQQLWRIAIEILGINRDKKAQRYLIKKLKSANPAIRMVVAKTLGNLNSEDVRKALLERLSDSDPWVRLISYISLFRITGKELRADWFFTDGKYIKTLIDKYKKKLEGM